MRPPEDDSPGCRRQGAIVAVLALTGLASSFMFELVVLDPGRAHGAARGESRRHRVGRHRYTARAAIFTPIAGRLGDMYGKRRIVLLLLALLVLGSVIAAFSTSLLGVIIGSALQGAVIGVVPLGIAILRDVLHTKYVNSAIALISATLGVGGALGLPISAFVT